MEKLNKLKWVLFFLIILLLGGFLYSTYADWTLGMFQGTWNLFGAIIIIIGLIGTFWSAFKLKKK